jgi:hypothetical protein
MLAVMRVEKRFVPEFDPAPFDASGAAVNRLITIAGAKEQVPWRML